MYISTAKTIANEINAVVITSHFLFGAFERKKPRNTRIGISANRPVKYPFSYMVNKKGGRAPINPKIVERSIDTI